jgi:hypothetical protein
MYLVINGNGESYMIVDNIKLLIFRKKASTTEKIFPHVIQQPKGQVYRQFVGIKKNHAPKKHILNSCEKLH